MQTISREEYEKKYGASSAMKLEQAEISRSNRSTIPSTTPKDPMANRFTEAIGLGGATDVFGRLMSRSFVGNMLQTPEQESAAELNAQVTGQPVMSQQDINQAQIEAPTGKEVSGAVAQTAAIPLGAVITGGGSVAGQMAAGAGLGYLYDVGGNFAEGEEGSGAFAPGAETVAGAALPPVFRGAGAAFRGVGTLLARNAPALPTPAVPTVMSDAVGSVTTPLRETAREFAVNRPGRLIKRAGKAIQESKDMAKVYETAPPPVRAAIDADLDMRLVNAVSDADDATKQGYKQIVEIAEQGSDRLGVKPRPEIVAGDAAADQYGILNAKRQEVGGQIGEALDNLPTTTYQATPLYDEVDGLLRNNGITPNQTANGVQLDFTGSNIPPKQRTTIQALYELLTETGDSITPRQLYNKDRLLSQLQREARFDGVSDIMVKTPEGTDVDLFRALREVFTAELESVAPSIRPLNREYAQLRGLQDDIESTIFKSGNYQGTRDVDPAEFAQTNLRRLFSDAQSAADYRKIYDNLDAYSRALGYEGARADDLAAFATEMRKVYPDSVPETSATSIFGSAADKVMSAMNMGKANVTDQQQALRGLLGVQEKYTPAQAAGELFGKKSLGQRTKEALGDTRGAVNPEPLRSGNPFESLDYSTLAPKGEQLVRKYLAHIDGTNKLPAEEWKAVQSDMLDLANKANFNSKGGSNKAIADEAAERYQKQITNYESFNKGATPQTTLLEEAKGKTLDEFVKAQGTSVFRATDKAFDAKLLTDDGLFVSPKKSVAERYLGTGKKIDELVLEKNAKILSFENTPKALYDMDEGFAIPKDGGDGIEIAKYAKANGYDAVEYGVDPNNLVPEFAIVNKDVIKTKSQLEDIWNQANKTSLLEEAKKYDSADEFVRKPRGNEDTLYHYTNAEVGGTLKPRPDVELAEMNYLGDGVYVTNQKNGYEGSNELLAFPTKDLKVLDLTSDAAEERFLKQISKEIGTPVARSGGGLYDDLRLMASNIGENHQKVKDAVSKVSKGYGGIKANFAKYTDDDNYYELVINKDVDVKTPDQLTDIWKQANK